MLIPIDRPLIDAHNIRPAATQTVAAGFVATHDQRPVLLLTCAGANVVSAAPHIQAGVEPGQLLTILVTDDANRITITSSIAGGGLTKLNGNWVIADGNGIGAWLKIVWDGTHWWEDGRGNGEMDASGQLAYVEGISGVASGVAAHKEGWAGTASGNQSHVQNIACTASGNNSHAGGNTALADTLNEHAHGGGKFTSTGDAQYRRFKCRREITPAAGGAVIGLNNNGAGPIIPADSAWTFKAQVIGITQDAAEVCSWSVEGCIKRVGAAAAICTIQAVNIIHVDDASIILTVAVPAGDTLDLTVTDADSAAGQYRFSATIHVEQITFT